MNNNTNEIQPDIDTLRAIIFDTSLTLSIRAAAVEAYEATSPLMHAWEWLGVYASDETPSDALPVLRYHDALTMRAEAVGVY